MPYKDREYSPLFVGDSKSAFLPCDKPFSITFSFSGIGSFAFLKAFCNIRQDSRPILTSSHRGIAFKRRLWEQTGGYPEDIAGGEDTWLNTQWRKMCYECACIPEAKQYWKARDGWLSTFRMQLRNTRGHIAIGEPTGTFLKAGQLLVSISVIFFIIFGFYQSILWAVGAVLYSLYVLKRLYSRGRWRGFINPVNFSLFVSK